MTASQKPALLDRTLRVFLAALAVFFVCGSAGPEVAAQDEITLVASRSGFKPGLIKLRKGETARLLLRSADDEHCFALDAFRVEKRIAPGAGTALELTPDRVGEFLFYCCLEPENRALHGRLVVTE